MTTVDRTPTERYERLLRGACPDCHCEALRADDDGVLYCPTCDWSQD